jgi:hypothetical protein
MSGDLELTVEAQARIARLGERYLWWDGGAVPHTAMRTVAQIMNLGTYEDILSLESLLAPPLLARVMLNAQPGWFSARAWEFWRGRLGIAMPGQPPVRSIAHAG